MAKSQDLFDDSTMSFGEHLETLRVHLWKAIVGLTLCVIFALFIGDHIVHVVSGPIDRALQSHGIAAKDDIGGFNFVGWLTGYVTGTGNSTDGTGITTLKPLGNLPNLRQVGLAATNVSPEELRAFQKKHPEAEAGVDALRVSGLGHLRQQGARAELNDDYQTVALSLRGSEIAAEDLARIEQMTSLKRLDLQDVEIDDGALALLKSLKQLEFLNLSGTPLTDAGLVHLAGLTNLKRLDLRGTQITDAGLKSLEKLKSLTHLDLRNTGITDAGLASVAKLNNLEELFVSGAGVTDEGLKSVSKLKQLKQLELKETAVSDAGLKHLAGLDKLEVLNFTEGPITRDPFAQSLSPEMLEDYTIHVRVRAAQLAGLLHGIDPDAYPEPDAEFEDRLITLPIAAPEFREFRETAVTVRKPVTLNVQEAFMTYIKVAFVAGLLLGSPWVFYQLWLFVAAGLYPHERKYVYIYLPMSTILFLGGAVFCFFAVFPFVLDFLLGFNEMLNLTPQIRMSEWISFAILLPLMFGLSFQLPLVMLFLERISVFDASTYREKRRMSVFVISIIAMMLTPADPMSMMMMMVPLLVLYELGILLCSYSPARSPFETEAA